MWCGKIRPLKLACSIHVHKQLRTQNLIWFLDSTAVLVMEQQQKHWKNHQVSLPHCQCVWEILTDGGKKSLVKVGRGTNGCALGRGKNGCALGRGKNGCALPCPPSAFCTTHIYNLARKQALSKCTSMWYTNHYTAGITAKPTYHTCITGTTRKSVYQSNTELKWKAYQSAIHASCVPLPPQWPILKETKRNIPCTSFKQQHSSTRLPSLTPILQTMS